MTKLAIIDLDGVIADNTKRFEKAEEAKQAFLQGRYNPVAVEGFSVQKEAANLFWQTAFNSDLVAMDTLMPDVNHNLVWLYQQKYQVIFLTSRPESMREATEEWLSMHIVSTPDTEDTLIMKPPAAQYVKTVTWKALTVQMLASLFEASEILVVDDEGANLVELQKYDVSNMRLCSSLAEAVKPVEKTEDNPF